MNTPDILDIALWPDEYDKTLADRQTVFHVPTIGVWNRRCSGIGTAPTKVRYIRDLFSPRPRRCVTADILSVEVVPARGDTFGAYRITHTPLDPAAETTESPA